MTYSQNLEGCSFGNKDMSSFSNLLNSKAIEMFRLAFEKGQLAPLSLAQRTDDIDLYQNAANRLKGFEDILILGTGGSSLGGKTLYALSTQDKPRLHFLDNIDPFTFKALFQKIDLTKTGIVAISKSGTTVETLMQLLTCLQHAEKIDPAHIIAITEPRDNSLRKLAQSYGWYCLDHPTNVGGRYSCFSVVGLLPAILAGLDPRAFRKGANDVLRQHLTDPAPPALQGAAMGVYLEKHHGKTLSVMMPYSDQLDSFSFWYRQLWAESLGKEGKGTTPIRALGTVDQHSQLQLYLGGPKDKFFTLLTLKWEGEGDKILSKDVPEFLGKTMGDLFAAEQKATYQTLVNNGCPTRLITLDHLDEYHLGALMMHFMIETILASYLLEVNAFDQPAVEEGKRLAKEYIAL
jgi:glucose-6-phosphate isomerase